MPESQAHTVPLVKPNLPLHVQLNFCPCTPDLQEAERAQRNGISCRTSSALKEMCPGWKMQSSYV